MDRWNFEWWHVLVLYAALIIINAVLAIIEKEIGFIGAYLIIFVLVVSAQVFYHARKKNATTQVASAMNGWHFKLWDVIGLYIAALVIGAAIMRILLAPSSSSIGDLGMYLLVLAMLLVSANVFYQARKNTRRKNAANAV